MTTTTIDTLDEKKLQELEEKFDPEMRFRPTVPPATLLVAALLIALSLFHYYTAGFGLLQETTHRGIHLAFVLGLIFLVFGFTRQENRAPSPSAWWRPGGLPLWDWGIALAAAAAALYIPFTFQDLAFRVGNPSTLDVVMGTILVLCLLEATRRAMGWPLPVVAMAFIAYGLFGLSMPGILVH